MIPTHAGIAVVCADKQRVLLAKRAPDPTDAPDVAETWEFPGGGLDSGESALDGAVREYNEEIGSPLPPGEVVGGWISPDGVYQCFVYRVNAEFDVDFTPNAEVQNVDWFDQGQCTDGLHNLRPEVQDSTDWDLVFGPVSRNEDDMAQNDPGYSAIPLVPLLMHGVLCPEAAPSGDGRGFTDGAVTTRPLRLPFGWQEWTASGHDQAITVGSIDRMMRKDGLIHWEGSIMTSVKADEFVDLLSFMGQYGISIDGVNGNIDGEKSQAEGMAWFDAVKVAGAVACSVPAFAEAYVALGAHPDMPAIGSEAEGTTVASIDIIGARRVDFGRGPGYVTNPVATNRIHDYWTKKGEPGYAKVAWGTPGDFARAKALIGEEIAKHSPKTLPFLNQIIAQWHYDALGYYPSTHAKMLRDAEGKGGKDVKADAEWSPVLTAAAYALLSKEGSLEVSEALFNEAYAEGRIIESGLCEDGAILYDLNDRELSAAVENEELILTASASKKRVLPPLEYFQRHPDGQGLVIEEPDAQGFRRTYGYAAEWGVCHIGKDGVCTEVPEDPTGNYADFHKGRVKTDKGEIRTGLITYGVKHRGAKELLAETATQAHFDDISRAWAVVVCGEDERGVWFSGIALPTVTEDWLFTIQASGQVSGEWVRNAMRTMLTVNVAGFPIEDSSAVYGSEGEVLALVASAFRDTLTASLNGTAGSACSEVGTPAQRMAVLREIDAEVRFADMRNEWNRKYL